jgi:hypothetical protein
MIPATTTKRAVRARNGPHTHARCASCLQTEETKKERQNARLADARRATNAQGSWIAPRPVPATGTSHHLTMSKQHKACHALASRECGNAWWAWADLNGRPHAYQACALTS